MIYQLSDGYSVRPNRSAISTEPTPVGTKIRSCTIKTHTGSSPRMPIGFDLSIRA